MPDIAVRQLTAENLDLVAPTVSELGGDKPRSQYERYLSEQDERVRTVFLAFLDETLAGYVARTPPTASCPSATRTTLARWACSISPTSAAASGSSATPTVWMRGRDARFSEPSGTGSKPSVS